MCILYFNKSYFWHHQLNDVLSNYWTFMYFNTLVFTAMQIQSVPFWHLSSFFGGWQTGLDPGKMLLARKKILKKQQKKEKQELKSKLSQEKAADRKRKVSSLVTIKMQVQNFLHLPTKNILKCACSRFCRSFNLLNDAYIIDCNISLEFQLKCLYVLTVPLSDYFTNWSAKWLLHQGWRQR